MDFSPARKRQVMRNPMAVWFTVFSRTTVPDGINITSPGVRYEYRSDDSVWSAKSVVFLIMHHHRIRVQA